MNILVTGVAGFVGCNLSDRLLLDGDQVYGVDNLAAGNMSNLDESRKSKNFKFQELDVTNAEKVLSLDGNFEVIVHLAAHKIPKYHSAKKTLEVNTIGTRNMLELARKKDAVFVFSSTSDVYGKNRDVPFAEDADLVLGPTNVKRWSYASSKIFDEHLINAYNQDYGLKFVILRYFNSFGVRNSPTWLGGPISVFIQNSLEGKPIPIHGDGSQQRCFCYVTDTVEGTRLAIKTKSGWNDVYNIGNDRTERSIKEIAEIVIRTTGRKVPLEFTQHEKLFGKYEEVYRRIPLLDKARGKLGFEPKVNLEEGIRLTYEWQLRLLK